jgi:acyl carrier protein
MDREKILGLVLSCAHVLNEERPKEDHITINEEMLLLEDGSLLDSLAIVSLIVDVETLMSNELGRPLVLTDNRAMSQNISPFLNVKTLVNYIENLCANKVK